MPAHSRNIPSTHTQTSHVLLESYVFAVSHNGSETIAGKVLASLNKWWGQRQINDHNTTFILMLLGSSLNASPFPRQKAHTLHLKTRYIAVSHAVSQDPNFSSQCVRTLVSLRLCWHDHHIESIAQVVGSSCF